MYGWLLLPSTHEKTYIIISAKYFLPLNVKHPNKPKISVKAPKSSTNPKELALTMISFFCVKSRWTSNRPQIKAIEVLLSHKDLMKQWMHFHFKSRLAHLSTRSSSIRPMEASSTSTEKASSTWQSCREPRLKFKTILKRYSYYTDALKAQNNVPTNHWLGQT